MTKYLFTTQGRNSTQQRRKYRESTRPTAQGALAYLGMPAPPSPFPIAELQLPRPHFTLSILRSVENGSRLSTALNNKAEFQPQYHN